ncbi:hypothetical protein V8C44DRAFT_324816 [Trichoderma aethiopicum]
MVYCGKPSKGCSNCRERKIRVGSIQHCSHTAFALIPLPSYSASLSSPSMTSMNPDKPRTMQARVAYALCLRSLLIGGL